MIPRNCLTQTTTFGHVTYSCAEGTLRNYLPKVCRAIKWLSMLINVKIGV